MDQTNPLSEVTHKRRLSALGPGGLTRERAGFEVRDVHPTHYGRICPIETPEGPNIGLISSLSTYARVNEYGFIETPYRGGRGRHRAARRAFFSALQEENHVIAPGQRRPDKEGKLRRRSRCARRRGDFVMVKPEEVTSDVSPNQLVSVAAALVPFLENDDANRALMGSNMQRQAVPLVRTEAPLVGTGMERWWPRTPASAWWRAATASSSRSTRPASWCARNARGLHGRGGRGRYLQPAEVPALEPEHVHQPEAHRPRGRPGEEGRRDRRRPSTEMGELALGRNVVVAFMPWHGYNFEDSILISSAS
jgi:DNA-directed RNA polymerase subunit beta